ncbi:MAG: IS200/IS605 family transposase [Limisphaerales bacterium]
MSLHTYSRVWLHLVWATLERRPLLAKPAAARLSGYLSGYANEKGIYMKINYVNADHVHALIDLPTKFSMEEVMQLFKGSSSHWINENNLVAGKFGWGRGYGVFSVSESTVAEVARYISSQEEHHRNRNFQEELKLFVERYGLEWREG